MQRHGGRIAYFILGEGVILEGRDFSCVGGQSPATPPPAAAPPRVSGLKFGRLFGRTRHKPRLEERARIVQKLIRLGLCMNDPARYCGQPAVEDDDESDAAKLFRPLAGYTYLGQFIAHEITYDSTGDLLASDLQPENLRTPQVDLDSLYGRAGGPKGCPALYRDGAYLKTGDTIEAQTLYQKFPNDLLRGTSDTPSANGNPQQAVIGDPRNDENLALAQTHVAFIHFHNKVVDKIKAENPDYPTAKLFELAREQVIRHYQWIILYDFLPQIVRADVLDCVMRHGIRWFKDDDGLFMPLEFSVAAFRIGHSMVRDKYEWNPLRRTDKYRNLAASLMDLFKQTGFLRAAPAPASAAGARSDAGESVPPTPVKIGLDGMDKLKSDWVIDWRHFYDFSPLPHVRRVPKQNFSAKFDTVFDMHLDTVEGFPAEKIDKMQRAITVRNLLRGFYLGLPTGEEVAEWVGETPLTRKQVASGPHESLLDDPVFWGKTPLWYYILKEAELLGFGPDGVPGNRLGPVGSRIVAETLIGLIKHSPYSILDAPKWYPKYTSRGEPGTESALFGMIDLLDFADVVDPVARYIRQNAPYIDLQE
jgi:hypothetical protein